MMAIRQGHDDTAVILNLFNDVLSNLQVIGSNLKMLVNDKL